MPEIFKSFSVRTYKNSPIRYYIGTSKRTLRINKKLGKEIIKYQMDSARAFRKMTDIIGKILKRK